MEADAQSSVSGKTETLPDERRRLRDMLFWFFLPLRLRKPLLPPRRAGAADLDLVPPLQAHAVLNDLRSGIRKRVADVDAVTI